MVRIAPARPGRRSEHEPELATATVEVSGTIKGAVRGQLAIMFSRSGDEAMDRAGNAAAGLEKAHRALLLAAEK